MLLCVGYFLEDAIEMTNFRPSLKDKKKKSKDPGDENIGVDPEEVRAIYRCF